MLKRAAKTRTFGFQRTLGALRWACGTRCGSPSASGGSFGSPKYETNIGKVSTSRAFGLMFLLISYTFHIFVHTSCPFRFILFAYVSNYLEKYCIFVFISSYNLWSVGVRKGDRSRSKQAKQAKQTSKHSREVVLVEKNKTAGQCYTRTQCW